MFSHRYVLNPNRDGTTMAIQFKTHEFESYVHRQTARYTYSTSTSKEQDLYDVAFAAMDVALTMGGFEYQKDYTRPPKDPSGREETQTSIHVVGKANVILVMSFLIDLKIPSFRMPEDRKQPLLKELGEKIAAAIVDPTLPRADYDRLMPNFRT